MSSTSSSPARSKLLRVTLISVTLLFILLLVITVREPQRLARAEQQHQAKLIEKGASLYSLHCHTCHGIRGEGIGQLGPTLSDSHFFTGRIKEVGWQSTLQRYISATIEQGRMMGTRPIYAGNGSTAVMAPWLIRNGGPLRGDEIEALTSFILNWHDTALGKIELARLVLPEPSRQDPKLLEHGKRIFSENCARCHQFREIQMQTSQSGPDLTHVAENGGTRLSDVSAEEYLRRSILVPDEFIVPGYESNPAAERCNAVLSTSELLALSAFLLQ